MRKNRKSKKLQNLIMSNFLAFTIVYLVCYLVFVGIIIYVAGMLETRENRRWEQLLIPDLEHTSLEEIDWSGIEESQSGIEILDENLNITYRKGVDFHKDSSYSVKDLFDLIQMPVDHNNVSKVGMISFDTAVSSSSLQNNNVIPDHAMLVYQTFYNEQGEWQLCLQMIPEEYLDKHMIRITAPDSRNVIVISGLLVAIGGIVLLILILKLFSKRISTRIGSPVASLTDGLKEITRGNYETRLDYEAENELSQMKDTFNYMAEQMQRGEEEKKHFERERQMLFSNIAHDLRTPITTILGYSKALTEDMVKEEDRQDYLLGIQQKSERVSELINLLFSYTKLDNEEYHLNLQSTDIVEFVRVTVAENYKICEQNEIELEVQIPDQLVCKCSIDPVQCRRAITNILMNAVKHNPPKTTVYVAVDRTVEQPEYIQIDIADNGAKIPEELENRLFEPFVLGDESRNSHGGNGLGLSIAKRIVEKHGGKLMLIQNSKVQSYTKCFRILLPVQEDAKY